VPSPTTLRRRDRRPNSIKAARVRLFVAQVTCVLLGSAGTGPMTLLEFTSETAKRSADDK